MARRALRLWPAVLVGSAMIPAAAAATAQLRPQDTTPAGGQVVVTSTSGTSIPLTLVSQTPWVAPGQVFDLKFRAGDASTPVTQLGVSVTVYGCLSSVSAFDQSVSSSGPSGTSISSTRTPLALSGLTVPGGGFDLSMPVSAGHPASTAPAGAFAINLSSTGGQCGASPSGVYPVRVQLVNMASGQVVGGLTTHLVYSDTPANTQKLRLAVVLPIQAVSTPSTSPTPAELRTNPSAALQPLSTTTTAAISGTVDTIATQHSSVAVTLEANPQTVVALGASGRPSALAAVSQLATLAATPSVHQFASSPFTPVNASSLVTSGLSGELALQVSRGSQVLATDITHSTATLTAGTAGQLGPWFANDGLDAATLTQLQSVGYSELVLPSGSVSSAPTNGSTAEPFLVSSSRGASMTAVAANSDLASRFTGAQGDPVLAAHQLVAEVAQMYYEKPNDTSPRALVAAAPTSWSDDPAFVDALLTALTGNPIIQPVTAADLFDTLPTSSCQNGCRLSPTSGGSGLPVAAIRTQRQRVDGFTAAAATAHEVSTGLGDLVLASESEALRPNQQAEVLRDAGAAVDAQLAQLVVTGDPITLTAQRGAVQVTIISNAPYPVTASVTLTSDKLLFADGTTEWTTKAPLTLTGGGHTNSVPVTVQARTSGPSKITIVLRSPIGGLTLSTGQVVVHSTATSLVGVLLSLGAVLVLVVWWIRTSRRRRNRPVGHFEAAEAPAEPR
jgi:hypothetical protein